MPDRLSHALGALHEPAGFSRVVGVLRLLQDGEAVGQVHDGVDRRQMAAEPRGADQVAKMSGQDAPCAGQVLVADRDTTDTSMPGRARCSMSVRPTQPVPPRIMTCMVIARSR